MAGCDQGLLAVDFNLSVINRQRLWQQPVAASKKMATQNAVQKSPGNIGQASARLGWINQLMDQWIKQSQQSIKRHLSLSRSSSVNLNLKLDLSDLCGDRKGRAHVSIHLSNLTKCRCQISTVIKAKMNIILESQSYHINNKIKNSRTKS